MPWQSVDVANAATGQSIYRVVEGQTLIELKARDIRELFNSLDPAPFERRDLTAAAEDYVVGALREIGLTKPVKMLVYLPDQALAAAHGAGLAASFRNYFRYRQLHYADEVKLLLRRGFTSLLIALVFMFACLSLRQFINPASAQPALPAIREGLLVIAWVAMWRPLEIFLYDWWPIWRQAKIFRHLSQLPIDLVELPAASAAPMPPSGRES